MIDAIRHLRPEDQRALIRLLEPTSDWQTVDEAALLRELVGVLRRALDVPRASDLGEYLRRRLVETVTVHFGLLDDTDLSTDAELATLLIDFVLAAADLLTDTAESQTEFDTFLRTKSKSERTRLLVESRKFAALATDQAFNVVDEREKASRLQDQDEAHALTARAILDGLVTASSPKSRARPSDLGSIRSRLAGASGGMLAATAAPPLGALAGGLFMAGLRPRADGSGLHSPEIGDPEAAAVQRRQRARRSTLIQAVVVVCAFVAGADLGNSDTETVDPGPVVT